jgi:hypothetical protein
MTIHGAHETTFVLTRGGDFARWAGLDRLRIKVFPFVWNVPFGPAPAFLPSLPIPTKVTVQLGAPLDWTRHEPGNAEDPEVLQACYDEITEVMQRDMDRMAESNPYPILTRLNELRPSKIAGRWISRLGS